MDAQVTAVALELVARGSHCAAVASSTLIRDGNLPAIASRSSRTTMPEDTRVALTADAIRWLLHCLARKLRNGVQYLADRSNYG